ncbi:MAG TPA: AAA family ATPase [Pirellulales bacterium]|jgi:type II secretory pathway predicted ATPase ExeA|nr:AAA family ATPase [Pirellulales bacterium]
MYEACFGFNERPFAAAVSAKRYFPGDSIDAARENLARCIDRAEGVGLLVGPAGTGKSLLCQVLAEQFRRALQVALLASGQLCTRRALLQAISFELGLPYRGMEEGDLRLALVDHLSPRSKAGETTSPDQASLAGAPLLLIVDEAHTLPMRLLEELRLITNLIRNGQPRVRLVLAGSPQLEDRFAHPKMESFNQRVATRCYLEALDRQQTIEYVRHQIRQVGGEPERIFTPDALEAIPKATDGIPRLINQVCDHVLLLAFAGGMQQITALGIEEAWADLQQLPTPWNAAQGAPAPVDGKNVVEFGTLDDELLDDLPAAVPFRSATQPDDAPAATETDALASLREVIAPPHEYHDDFHPAGSIGPEVELIFPQGSNPFRNDFREEEVVLDRYTSLETNALANRPLVRSPESRDLAALLKAANATVKELASPRPAMAVAPATWPGGVPTAAEQPSAASQAAAASGFEPMSDSAASLPQVPAANESVAAAIANSSESPAATPKVLAQLSTTSINDDDLIVIEDPPEMRPPVQQPPARVRRQEYRQLFAKLRRG